MEVELGTTGDAEEESAVVVVGEVNDELSGVVDELMSAGGVGNDESGVVVESPNTEPEPAWLLEFGSCKVIAIVAPPLTVSTALGEAKECQLKKRLELRGWASEYSMVKPLLSIFSNFHLPSKLVGVTVTIGWYW